MCLAPFFRILKKTEVYKMNDTRTVKPNEAKRAYMRQYMKEWRAANREKTRAYNKEWREKHPDKVREYQARYWERKADEMMNALSAASEGGASE